MTEAEWQMAFVIFAQPIPGAKAVTMETYARAWWC